LNTSGNEVSQIAINRQGTKVAFVVWTTYKNIYIMNLDGSGLTQLTTDNWDTSSPCFSPDGSKILFTSYANGTAQLWTMNTDGTGQAALTNMPSGAMQGRYSPNGQKIAFTSGGFSDDLYIMNANGTGATALAASATDDEDQPCFNVDGSKVIFVKTFDDGTGNPVGQIMSIPAGGGTATRLTSDLRDDREPVVSLDGTTILFTRATASGREVYRMTLTGTGVTVVTSESANTVSPSTGN